ncbi:hypothetical protein J2S70_000178 [Trueperella bonasi]|uniref:SseB protein N-terminal domain-containing protein n=1 Tax=Trueperella bonasi TaxID=312286 RepID=A0ABT9NDY1_9ACTO|nr:SseB family protein [Trueperella bonasi]MDP9805596.1 hypothetical protein [Trueperella bonasi]
MRDRRFAPNPYAHDDGAISIELARAFEQPESLRTGAIVKALGRVLVPVLPHAHPGREADGSVAVHVAPERDPLACGGEDLVTVEFPGGRKALPIFSSVDSLRAWNASARPVPVDVKRVAVAALRHGDGVLTLDEGSPAMTWLGRSATVALASGAGWTPPWRDREIIDRMANAIDGGFPELERVKIEPGPHGRAVVELHLDAHATRQAVMDIVHTVSAMMATDAYIKARLDVVEIRPVHRSLDTKT